MSTITRTLPEGFAELEPYVDDWAKPTRAERYATRLSKPLDELVEFYDAIAPRAEEAIAYLDTLDLDALPDDAAPQAREHPSVGQATAHPGFRLSLLRHGRRAACLT